MVDLRADLARMHRWRQVREARGAARAVELLHRAHDAIACLE